MPIPSFAEFKARCNATECNKVAKYHWTAIGPACDCEKQVGTGFARGTRYWLKDAIKAIRNPNATTAHAYSVSDEAFKAHILFNSYVGVLISVIALGVAIAAYRHQRNGG